MTIRDFLKKPKARQSLAPIAMPVKSSERYAILDVLRGFALLGIAIANFPEFSLYSFLQSNAAEALPTAAVDHIVHYLQYIFIDGKFYTIFSLLFGVGFSIIIYKALRYSIVILPCD